MIGGEELYREYNSLKSCRTLEGICKAALMALCLLIYFSAQKCYAGDIRFQGDSESNRITPASYINYADLVIPDYDGTAAVAVHQDKPFFDTDQLTATPFQSYGELDDLGRCTAAFACIGVETVPQESRKPISEVIPSGWENIQYAELDGEYLYNRCHLIAYQLTGQNANERNLITGTQYLNTQGMLPIEEEIAHYLTETSNHVWYRVTPFYAGEDLLADGVLIEAQSVEDDTIQKCVYCYNVQPGIDIDYASGKSSVSDPDLAEKAAAAEGIMSIIPLQSSESSDAAESEPVERIQPEEVNSDSADSAVDYIANTNSKKFHYPECSSVGDMKEKNKLYFSGTRDELISKGYEPCKRCKP